MSDSARTALGVNAQCACRVCHLRPDVLVLRWGNSARYPPRLRVTSVSLERKLDRLPLQVTHARPKRAVGPANYSLSRAVVVAPKRLLILKGCHRRAHTTASRTSAITQVEHANDNPLDGWRPVGRAPAPTWMPHAA